MLRRPKPRKFLAHRCAALAERWLGRSLVPFAYPPPEGPPRYGYGRPAHAGLLAIFRQADERCRRNLEVIAGFTDDLLRIDVQPSTDPRPTWLNGWLWGLDCAAIYGLVRARSPANYVEIGSGMSTLFARRAIRDGDLPTRITSIDPAPRRTVEAQCDRILRAPLESVDLSIFDRLGERDIVFMDGSHQVFTGSDATVFFLDVLPRLPADVLVGLHDVLLPDDYPPEWAEYHWAEQYLMASYLLARGFGIRLELACHYVTEYSDAHRILDGLWSSPQLADVSRRGSGLWFTTVGRD